MADRDVVKEIHCGPLVGKIYLDEDCPNPYEDDEMIRIVVLHRRYADPAKGKCGKTPEELDIWVDENCPEWFTVPLWMYDHSGTAYKTGDANPFSCPWDSGRVGFLCLKRSEFNLETDADFYRFAEQVAETYTEWANGDCYGWVLEDPQGEEIESCWGFVGDGRKHAEVDLRGTAELHRPDYELVQAVHGIAENYQDRAKMGDTDLKEEVLDLPGCDWEGCSHLPWKWAVAMAKKAFLEEARAGGRSLLMSEGWLDEDYWADIKITDEDLIKKLEAIEVPDTEETTT